MSKTTMKVHFSSGSDEWATPMNLFKRLNKRFKFNLDPCCTAKTAKCKTFYTKETDGLSKDWGQKTVFVNPPYSRGEQEKWIAKCWDAAARGAIVVLLIPARTDTQTWHEYCQKGIVRFLKGRVHFINGEKCAAAPFPSCLVAFAPDPISFVNVSMGLDDFIAEWNNLPSKERNKSA